MTPPIPNAVSLPPPLTPPSTPPAAVDVEAVRRQFPALDQRVHGHPLVYLDSAATSLRPRAVLDAARTIDERDAGNIHRGVHTLSSTATERYEGARERVRRFLGARDAREIVFTRGTTESLNLVAQTVGRQRVGPGDEIVVSRLEHHSNLVPWQLLCAERGARLLVAPLDEQGQLDLPALAALLTPRTKLVALAHASNVLGSVLPIARAAELVHAAGALLVVDGAQAAAHLPVDVAALGCDFYCLSAHKLYGPTGAGALWGRLELLESMAPWQGGGGMIGTVSLDGEATTWADPPWRFEAGTPPIAAVVGMAAAMDWIESTGPAALLAHESALLDHALAALATVEGLRLFGRAMPRVPVLAFSLDGVHPHDLATVLDQEGIAIRAGHHCAQPLHHHLGVRATARASLAAYNTTAEIDLLALALGRAARLFRA